MVMGVRDRLLELRGGRLGRSVEYEKLYQLDIGDYEIQNMVNHLSIYASYLVDQFQLT